MKTLLLIILCLPMICYSKEKSLPHRIRVNPNQEEELGLRSTSELNIYRSTLYGNQFIEYETQDNLALGLYINNIPLNQGNGYKQTYVYDSYIGISKFFSISDNIKIGFGTQSGTELNFGPKNFLNLDFIQTEIELNNNLIVGAGMFYVNGNLSTTSTDLGASVNLVYKFIPSVLWTEANFYSGSTNISGSVVNVFWKPSKKVSFYIGIQVPATNSGNEFAGNIGFNIFRY